MENRRFFLIAMLAVLGFITWQTWKTEQTAAASPVAQTAAPLGAAPLPQPTAAAGSSALPTATGLATPTAPIVVQTDVLRLEINPVGGDIQRAELLAYPRSKEQASTPVSLLNPTEPNFFSLQAGLAGQTAPLTTPNTVYSSAQQGTVQLAAGADTLAVSLQTRVGDLEVQKLWTLKRGSYQVALSQTVRNASTTAASAAMWVRMQRSTPSTVGEPPFSQTFTGVGFYEQKDGGADYRFKKVALAKLGKEPIKTTQDGGWLSMVQHYFQVAIIPNAKQGKLSFETQPTAQEGGLAQVYGSLQTVAPGAAQSFATTLYIGPTLNGKLDDVAPGLALTEDYGILAFIAKPLFWLLSHLHSWVGNWGVAIILLTLVVKLLMYKLSAAQFRSMARMKKFAPRLAEIKERYANDREKQSKAMMELYTKEGFNPLAGCWPMLVQFPVFIALFWVLSQSVELRQAPFMLWIQDLTAPDPFYVLPVLFGASMWLQQKLQGSMATMDPMQQKMMQFMPIAMTAFFAFFPAGLNLYWFVSNVISIVQLQVIQRSEAARSGGK